MDMPMLMNKNASMERSNIDIDYIVESLHEHRDIDMDKLMSQLREKFARRKERRFQSK